jgi:hypothetical protein
MLTVGWGWLTLLAVYPLRTDRQSSREKPSSSSAWTYRLERQLTSDLSASGPWPLLCSCRPPQRARFKRKRSCSGERSATDPTPPSRSGSSGWSRSTWATWQRHAPGLSRASQSCVTWADGEVSRWLWRGWPS